LINLKFKAKTIAYVAFVVDSNLLKMGFLKLAVILMNLFVPLANLTLLYNLKFRIVLSNYAFVQYLQFS